MKLIPLGRGQPRSYETPDKRFRVTWHAKQGARSCYSVRDLFTNTSLRAFNLEEVRATIRDMIANDRFLPETTSMRLAVRAVPRRFMGPRIEEKYEAELRELVNDKYVTRCRLFRASMTTAIEAAQAFARRRGWRVSDKRISWTTRDAAYERRIAEDATLPAAPALAFRQITLNVAADVHAALEKEASLQECALEDVVRRLLTRHVTKRRADVAATKASS